MPWLRRQLATRTSSMMAREDARKGADFRLASVKSLRRRRAAGTVDVPLPEFSSYLEPAP